MRKVALGEVADIERQGVDPSTMPLGTLYLGLEHIQRGGRIIGHNTVGAADLASTKFRFTSEHVLFGKLRPNLAKISRPNFDGVCSTDILPIRPGKHLDRDYLAHYLAQPSMVDLSATRATGANLPRLSPTVLAGFLIPLPPIDEQRRIAAILDHADVLRTERLQVLAHLDNLIQSIFNDMFGSGSYAEVSAGELMPTMRNGLSPATAGANAAQVLMLSAVTQGTFDPAAVKPGLFATNPPLEKRVSALDFMMCRGNGNKSLVGVGVYSKEDRPDLVFPDTVIAGRVDDAKVGMSFLTAAWKQRAVRRQIESLARTTNGTFKVNQQTLSRVRIPLPPLSLQRDFERRIEVVNTQRDTSLNAQRAVDELFASLQARAFRGEL